MSKRGFIGILFVFFFLCSSLVRAQNLNEQYLEIMRAIEKSPDDLSLKIKLAWLYTQGREFSRALEVYNDINKKFPNNVQILTESCFLATEIKDDAQAEFFCQALLKQDSQNLVFMDNLALSRFKRGYPFEAMPLLLEAHKKDQNFFPSILHIAEILFSLDRPHGALDWLEQVDPSLLKTEEQVAFYDLFYRLNTKLKNYDKAYDAIKKAHQISKNDLYFGKLVKSFINKNQMISFLIVSLILLWFSAYLGKRLNRFLKNEKI